MAQYSFLEHANCIAPARRPIPATPAGAVGAGQRLGQIVARTSWFRRRQSPAKCNSSRSISPRSARTLGEVSPVVRTLATEQFDDYVKRVRIFAHPRIAAELRRLNSFTELLERAITETE